jgi:hypothetical protein
MTGTPDPEALDCRRYLTTSEAAEYLGYRRPVYADPREAFVSWIRRLGPQGPPTCRRGRRLLFLRADLDRHVQRTREAGLTARREAEPVPPAAVSPPRRTVGW